MIEHTSNRVEKKHTTRSINLKLLFVLVLALCTVFCISACSENIIVAGKPVDRQTANLDLRNCEISSAAELLNLSRLRELTALDLRDNPLDRTDIDLIQIRIPKCNIRWSVPLGMNRYDSESETITIPNFSQTDISLLEYFTHLTMLDASGSTDYQALITAQAENEDIKFVWTCSAAGKTFYNTDETILCAKGTTLTDVENLLRALPSLKTIDMRETDVLADDIRTLQDENASVQFFAQAYLLDDRYDTTKTSLRLAATELLDVKRLIDQLVLFPHLKELDLRELPVNEQDISTLSKRYPEISFRWMVPILDLLRIDSDTESLDLRGYIISDIASFKQKLQLLKKLTYLDMCNCGPSDEEMALLRSSFPHVKIVWMLHVGYWEIRTDIKAFSMAQDKEHDGVRFTKVGDEIRRYRWVDDTEIAKLRYCTDIVALDIGHAYLISDISFIRELPKLRFLVISLTKVRDVSPIRTLKDLIFLEMFDLKQTEISVLYDLPQLEYLNCSTNLITDIMPFLSLTNLKRLWIIKCGFSDETLHTLKVGLPDTIVIAKGKHPTDTGWRFDNPAYLEMQELFGLAPQLDWASAEYLEPENQIP